MKTGRATRGIRSITRHAVIVVFAGSSTAAGNVAGLPAAARAVREVARAGVTSCSVAAPGGWDPDQWTLTECRRLASGMPLEFVALESLFGGIGGPVLAVSGELLVSSDAIQAALEAGPDHIPGQGLAWISGATDAPVAPRALAFAALAEKSRAVLRATGKPGDGIVSRYINRPISRTISGFLLRFRSVRPVHGTLINAALAIAMVLSLLLCGDAGLIAGALLFQAASIADGVDGEIARATFRTSDRGAMLDSAVDAATNIGFIAGVVINVWLHDNAIAAQIGGAGLAFMALGMLLLGLRSKAMGGPLTFNAVKDKFNTQPSKLRRWLTWLTMRDFYAFAGALLIVAGLAGLGLVMFAAVAAGWLVVVIVTLLRQPS